MIYVIVIALAMVCYVLGYVSGVDRAFKKMERTSYVGEIIIGHDTDGSKYTSLSILHGKDKFMSNDEEKYVMLGVRHVYPKGEPNDQT